MAGQEVRTVVGWATDGRAIGIIALRGISIGQPILPIGNRSELLVHLQQTTKYQVRLMGSRKCAGGHGGIFGVGLIDVAPGINGGSVKGSSGAGYVIHLHGGRV